MYRKSVENEYFVDTVVRSSLLFKSDPDKTVEKASEARLGVARVESPQGTSNKKTQIYTW